MDENGNDGGRTAMERLARMLGECVLSCNDSAASWAEAHGIDCDDVLYTVIKGNARSDIKRRIEDARGEDECTHTYPERELKRMTGMYLDGRRCTRGEVNEMVDAVEGWKAKAAELDALCIELGTDDGDEALMVARELLEEHYELKELREAGRIMPEGVSWPRYSDGEPVRILDWFGDEEVISLVFNTNGCALVARGDVYLAHSTGGDAIKRPAPRAVGADGREVKPGDTVCLAPKHREMAWSTGPSHNLHYVSESEEMTVSRVKNGRDCVVAWMEGEESRWCPASWLTHETPVLDRDGVEVRPGDTVWDEIGRKWTVMTASVDGCRLRDARPESSRFVEEHFEAPGLLTHERPDSWGRLREDAVNDYTYYWGCHASPCLECPCKTGGKKPKERYGVGSCRSAMHLDLVARAERLAGVRGDA